MILCLKQKETKEFLNQKNKNIYVKLYLSFLLNYIF